MELFAICAKHMVQLENGHHCPQCAAEQKSLLSDTR
jgi:hypothetical protein